MLAGLKFAHLGLSADVEDAQALHRRLAHWNRSRLAPGRPTDDWSAELAHDALMAELEAGFVEDLRALVAPAAAAAPRSSPAFLTWFEALRDAGPGQWDPLFDWLAASASLDELRWFLEQEASGEAGFDDLVALTQVKLPPRPKLELARNYWDEMGRGSAGGMHGPMLDQAVRTLDLHPTIEGTAWQSLALANTMTALAVNRRYAYHSVGALGVVELTAPTRVAMVADGLKRVGAPAAARKYFALHAQLDVEHSAAWNAEAIAPLVEADPGCARSIAEGALMRLYCGAECFEAYRAYLWAGRLPNLDAA